MRAIKTVPEMQEDMLTDMETASERKRRLYKIDSEEFKKAELAADIGRAIEAISSNRKRVDFHNIEDVRQRIIDYFTACANAGVYPSVQGLAVHGFGISRQALNQWRTRSQRDKYRTGNETRKEVERLIDCACDMMADVLTNQSLHNNANPVQVLFQLKNNHAFADKVELAAVPYDNEHDDYDEEEIKARLQMYIDSLPEPDEE